MKVEATYDSWGEPPSISKVGNGDFTRLSWAFGDGCTTISSGDPYGEAVFFFLQGIAERFPKGPGLGWRVAISGAQIDWVKLCE